MVAPSLPHDDWAEGKGSVSECECLETWHEELTSGGADYRKGREKELGKHFDRAAALVSTV